jgi:hypothetical protein
MWLDKKMTRRNSPNAIKTLDDLSRLSTIVVDKRLGKRASAKKSRRNRHYEKQFIRNTLAHPLTQDDYEQQSGV